MTVRVRIAPSPTGLLHIGNARSALFNWLFARHGGGTFILRIDDTDRARSEEQFEEDILEGLRWLGLDWDEGIEVGGPHGTYRQSDRFERYSQVADQLVERQLAYLCFCTPWELDERRRRAEAEGHPPGYDGRCRSIDPSTAKDRRNSREASVVRLAVPRPGVTEFSDVVRGEMRFDHKAVDDFVLLRSDRSPTYHLASTVDDVDYEITHVARGEDLLPSTPKHILLTQALGAPVPTYAHLPLLFGPDGRKLSKRHGDVSLRAYREGGYLPEAVFNYLSLLGWSYEAETTIFSREQAVARFVLSNVSKNPAVFDPEKLQWMNGIYIRALEAGEFCRRSRPFLERGLGRTLDDNEWGQFEALGPMVQERVKLLTEVGDLVGFLYVPSVTFDEASWRKVMGADTARAAVDGAIEKLMSLEDWAAPSIEAALRSMLDEQNVKARKGLQPIRVSTTGSSISPPLFETLEVLGREATLDRLRAARALL